MTLFIDLMFGRKYVNEFINDIDKVSELLKGNQNVLDKYDEVEKFPFDKNVWNEYIDSIVQAAKDANWEVEYME
jgi:hypothetical protein